jgi:hypothetical protein
MTTSDSSKTDPPERRAKLLERGLGSQFNITIVAALLSLVVAVVTSLITTRIASETTLEELRRDQERQSITRLEIAQLSEIDATVAVVVGGLPAKFPVQGETISDPGSDRVVHYLSAQRECDAARDAVRDPGIRAASKKASDVAASIARAPSLEAAQRYDPELREARQRAIMLMHQALRAAVS